MLKGGRIVYGFAVIAVFAVLVVAVFLAFPFVSRGIDDGDIASDAGRLYDLPEDMVYSELISFSHLPGTYTEAFFLEIFCADEDYEVRYSHDCKAPTAESSLYTKPYNIRMSKNSGDGVSVTVIRAAAFTKEGVMVGREVTATYMLCDDPAGRYSNMIISIVAEPDDLYGYERGIMVDGIVADEFRKNRPDNWYTNNVDTNYHQHGREWERMAHIEFFEADGTVMLSQMGGVRISGGWTRANEQKSLRIFARDEYQAGANLFRCDLFSGLTSANGAPVDEFKSLLLRTGSNNNYSSVISSQAMMRLADTTSAFSAYSRFAAVYLNGKYYGIIGVYEDFSPQYFEAHFGIDRNEITCINGAASISGVSEWVLDNGPESELTEFFAMQDFIIGTDMKAEENYKRASEMLDIDNFIQYMCFGSYIGMADWISNNVRIWRYFGNVNHTGGYNPRAGEYGYDGRWRFILKDMDSAGGYGHPASSQLTMHINADGHMRLNSVFKSLYKNQTFYEKVCAVYSDMMNTIFKPDNALLSLTETQLGAVGEMKYFLEHYGYNAGSVTAWNNTLHAVRAFFPKREENAKKDLKRKYKGDWVTAEVTVEGGGSVKFSTISVCENMTLDYLNSIAYDFDVVPDEGWELLSLDFVGCAIDEESGMLSFDELEELEDENAVSTQVFKISAVFGEIADAEHDALPRGLIINEVKYLGTVTDKTPDWIEIYNNTDDEIYLRGYSLTTVKKGGNPANMTDIGGTFTFPAAKIGAGEYMVIVCGADDPSMYKSAYHAEFSLTPNSDIALTKRDKSNVLDRITLSEMAQSHSLSRNPDDGNWSVVNETTPGERNINRAETYSFMSTVANESLLGKTIFNMTEITELFAKRDGKDGLWIEKSAIKRTFGTTIEIVKMLEKIDEFVDEDGFIPMEEVLRELEATSYHRVYIKELDAEVYLRTK